MPGSKEWRLLGTEDDLEFERTFTAMAVPGGVVLRSETNKYNPGGGISESMVFIPQVRLLEQAPADWAIFRSPVSMARPAIA